MSRPAKHSNTRPYDVSSKTDGNGQSYDIYSSTSGKRKNYDIYSKTSKGKKAVHVLAWILFVLAVAAVIAVIVHFTVSDIIPLKYILVIIAVLGILTGVQLKLVSGKRKLYFKRIVSLILSAVVIYGSFLGMGIVKETKESILNFSVDEGEVSANRVDITKKPFFIYLSGIDNTAGENEIPDKGLSDVNMVIAVDPTNARILMVSIPRDFYVGLWGDQNKLDKLTHAGRNGVECSMQTLGALFGVDFNYYVKVNFKSLYDIVNAVGGITVDSEFAFTSRHSYTERVYTFVKGENKLDGDSALAFSRERESFAGGDRQRGKNQQIVIKAIIDKVVSPQMLNPTKVGEVLDSVTKNTRTNFNHDEIMAFVKFELDKIPPWDIQSMSVDGTGASKTTYSYPRQRLYVMVPNQETVDAAKVELAKFKQ